MKVEMLYRCLKLYNVIFMNWLKYWIAQTIFTLCVCIVVVLYVTCRPSGLPFLIYCVFPVAGALAWLTLFWICYDAVIAKRTCDEALGSLQSRTGTFFGTLGATEKREMMRRASALQPVYIGLGQFAEMTLEVFLSMSDEILSQLLFLLSL